MLQPSPAAAAQPSPAVTRTRSRMKPFPKRRAETMASDTPKPPGVPSWAPGLLPHRDCRIEIKGLTPTRTEGRCGFTRAETEPHLCFHTYPTRAEVLGAPPASPSHMCPPKSRAPPSENPVFLPTKAVSSPKSHVLPLKAVFPPKICRFPPASALPACAWTLPHASTEFWGNKAFKGKMVFWFFGCWFLFFFFWRWGGDMVFFLREGCSFGGKHGYFGENKAFREENRS